MADRNKPTTGKQPNRSIETAIRAVNADERRVTVSFSSEQPVDRWWGPEILAHDEGCVNLTRLNEIGVSLFNHDRSYVIGRIENAKLDATEKRCYADIVFDDDSDADLIFKKVSSGTLKGVSVGYSVDVWEEVMTNKTSSNGRFVGPCYIATRWTPMEVSIVSIPADDTVGVGREAEEPLTAPASGRADTIITNMEGEREMADKNTNNNQPPVASNDAAEREAVVKAERQRVSDITVMCREFDVDPTEHINSGASVDTVRAAILEKLKAERQPSNSANEIRGGKDETEKIRAAASDAILMRAGKTVDKPADGARDMRGMKLRDLAIDCLVRAGVANAHRLSDDELYRMALSPDSQFAGILNDTVNKSMATAYKAAQTTYQAWTGRGSNPDFKAATHYQISEAGELLPMSQSSEFKFDEMKDNGVSKALATFGRRFGLTRQAMINDDISILTKVPEAYVRAAGRGINKLVYKMVGSNPAIYDGKNLFHADHKNLGTAGVPSVATLGELSKLMRKQQNLRGKETLNIAPAFLLAPAALETDAQKLLVSLSDPASSNSGVANVFRNSLNLVVDAELDAYSEKSYYVAAAPGDIDTIEVTYLNGDDMPKLESRVGFDFLGIEWRIFIDYGVTVLDYRGLGKNAGQ